jgi:hypothetical protein
LGDRTAEFVLCCIVFQKIYKAPNHVRVWEAISQLEHLLQEPMKGTDLASTPENQEGFELHSFFCCRKSAEVIEFWHGLVHLGTLTRGEMAAKVPEEMIFWLKCLIDNIHKKKMPKAAALKSLENGAGTSRLALSHLTRISSIPPSHTLRKYCPPYLQGASKFPPTPVIVYQVVNFFIELMRALLIPASGAKPEKFSQMAAVYCLFRLRRMEGMGGPEGGLQKGAEYVDLWVHAKFRIEVWARHCALIPICFLSKSVSSLNGPKLLPHFATVSHSPPP